MENINSEVIYYSRSTTTKGGTKITLQLPDEETGRLLDDIGAGRRYMMALVPLTDDDQPDEGAVSQAAKPKRRFNDLPLPTQAALLCQDERFWEFIKSKTQVFVQGEYDNQVFAADWIRNWCSIHSRAELHTDPEAAERFERIKTDFDAFRGRQAAP